MSGHRQVKGGGTWGRPTGPISKWNSDTISFRCSSGDKEKGILLRRLEHRRLSLLLVVAESMLVSTIFNHTLLLCTYFNPHFNKIKDLSGRVSGTLQGRIPYMNNVWNIGSRINLKLIGSAATKGQERIWEEVLGELNIQILPFGSLIRLVWRNDWFLEYL